MTGQSRVDNGSKPSRRAALRVLAGFSLMGVVAGCDAVGSGAAVARRILPIDGVTGGPLGSGPASQSGRIIFVRDGVLVETSGGTAQSIAAAAPYRDPSWSRDGKRLVAVASGTNHSDVVVLASDASSPRLLTHNRSDVAVQQSIWARKPVWSPDASRIAFVSDRDNHDMSLWQVTADGGKLTPLLLTKPFSGGLDWPSWSPDGTEIAYVSFATGVSQIRVLNLGQKQERELTNDSAGAYDPAWSPDGKLIAFVVREADQTYLALFQMTDGSRYRLTIEGVLRSPTWSRTGDSLAFIRLNGERFDAQTTKVTFGTNITAASPRSLDGTAGLEATAGLSWTG